MDDKPYINEQGEVVFRGWKIRIDDDIIGDYRNFSNRVVRYWVIESPDDWPEGKKAFSEKSYQGALNSIRMLTDKYMIKKEG